MSKQRLLMAYTAAALLTVFGAGSASADETVPPPSSSTTVLEQFDEESGIFWSPIDEQTIEIRLPN